MKGCWSVLGGVVVVVVFVGGSSFERVDVILSGLYFSW